MFDAMEAAIDGHVNAVDLQWRPQPSVTVIAASAGYPGSFKAGHPITGLEEASQGEGITIFHSGTSIADGALVTSGGRVLAVTAIADTLQKARDHAYAALDKIYFEGIYYRRDIAYRALQKDKQ